MPIHDTIRAVWRGFSSDRNSGTDNAESSGKVLLLLPAGSNRELLKRHLADQYEVIEPQGDVFPQEEFDLAVVDAASFRRWYQQLCDAKSREEPTFLPVVLVLPRADLRRRMKSFWDAVDEFVTMPVDRHEFSERIAMLLRARRMAVAQRSRLAYLVNHDRASGLPNQNLFMERLSGVIRDASLLDWKVCVAVVHIPLARILKSLGHQGLDRAATACSNRLRSLLGDDVFIARLTTEEWGIIHQSDDAMNSVLDGCAHVRKLADEPVEINGEHVHISPRVGVAMYADDAQNAKGLLDCAMSALSEAKDSEPVFYSADVQRDALRFIRTEARLHEALEKQQFELWYQPQINLVTGDIEGVEALVRWRLPGGELVPPGQFIPVAEAAGLVKKIDRWVLETACGVMNRWRHDGVQLPRISVNVTADDIHAPDFADIIEGVLDRHALPPPSLELELTETTLFEISDENMAKLARLRSQGVNIAIDDFGTGYSSLSYLHRLPITTLKIDKSFVDSIDADGTDEAIATTIVWLAKNFGLETVAEGIETASQARKLRSMGVVTGQGYFYAKPMPEDELQHWLSRKLETTDAPT